MISITIALIALACIYGGTLAGLFMQGFLPEHHLRAESKDAIKVGAGLIATMAALVLGLLVGSAKSSFDAMNTGITQAAAKAIMLDRILADYGPEAKDARDELRQTIAKTVASIWPEESTSGTGLQAVEGSAGPERVAEKVQQLSPQTESQRSIRSQALQMSVDPLALDRAGVQCAADAVSSGSDLLAHHTEPHLWPVGTAQSHGDGGNVPLRTVPGRCDLSHSRDEQSSGGND